MTKDSNTNAVSGATLTTSKIELQNILSIGLESKPNDIALFTSDEQQSWTYKKLNDVSDIVAHSYIKLGTKAGDRIASLLPNCVELFVHYVACFKVGLVLVPMNYRYTPPEIDHALQLSGSSILVSVVDREEDLKQLNVQPTLGIVSLGSGGTLNYIATFESLMKVEEEGSVDITTLRHSEAEGDASSVSFLLLEVLGNQRELLIHTPPTDTACHQ